MPSVDEKEDKDEENFNELHHYHKSQSIHESSPAAPYNTASSQLPFEDRLAHRREAYSAALGSDGYNWSEISLVSVNGHQTKEEEL